MLTLAEKLQSSMRTKVENYTPIISPEFHTTHTQKNAPELEVPPRATRELNG